jgi:hypothetical protein
MTFNALRRVSRAELPVRVSYVVMDAANRHHHVASLR